MEKRIVYQGPSVLGLLGVAFVVLKLLGYITWSWWWVTCPFWAPLAIVFVILVIAVIISAIVAVVK